MAKKSSTAHDSCWGGSDMLETLRAYKAEVEAMPKDERLAFFCGVFHLSQSTEGSHRNHDRKLKSRNAAEISRDTVTRRQPPPRPPKL